ncbi:MAG: CRISPR-associated endonuclease Cas3'' [Oscillospiraceae bacterium]|nr:CRISPR-associated endonuclease Cas3'' [Oscillospiraceae bacterium]
MGFIAPVEPESGREQSILEYLTSTAERAAGFGANFGARDAAYHCGLLHNIGKYSVAFQKRIKGSNIRVEHPTAGAVEAFGLPDSAAAFCIVGHHDGMPDREERSSWTPRRDQFHITHWIRPDFKKYVRKYIKSILMLKQLW